MSIALIDGNYLLKRAIYAKEKDTYEAIVSDDSVDVSGAYGFLVSLTAAMDRLFVTHCILIWDAGTSKRRLKLFPSYKKTRAQDNQTLESMMINEDFRTQKKILHLMADDLGLHWISVPHREADDVIIQAVRIIKKCTKERIYVVSGDRDLLQAVSDGATVYRPHNKSVVTKNNFDRLFPITDDKFILWRSLVGEKNRNDVDGVPGVGEKTATDLLKRKDIADVVDLVNYCSKPGTGKREAVIVSFFEKICLNMAVLDLGLEEFTEQELADLKDRMFDSGPSFNPQRVLQHLKKSNMQKFIRYISPFFSHFKLLNPITL